MAVCPISTPASHLEDVDALSPLGNVISERERERELDKYFRSAGIEPVRAGVERALAEGGRSSDATLTALAQLGSLKLQCERSFISLIDNTHQYIIGEATRSHGLHSNHTASASDAIYLGVRALELHWGVCPTTIQVFTGARKSFTSKVVSADPNYYIIRDFTADPCYADREYIVGWPHMRSYLEVPLRVHGGAVIGSYCVVHTEPRDFSELEIQTLAEIGTCIVDHLNLLRIKQEHDRAQQLIQGLGTIVAGSLDLPPAVAAALPLLQDPNPRPGIDARKPDVVALEQPTSITPKTSEATLIESKEREPRSSDGSELEHDLKDLRIDDSSSADPSGRSVAASISSTSASRSKSEKDVLAGHGHEQRRERRDGDDDQSMFADITKSIYLHNDVDGVLILDAQFRDSLSPVANSQPPLDAAAQEDDTPLSLCEEVGVYLRPTKERAALSLHRRPKHLSSSILHGLLNIFPAGTVLRREKDAPMLDQYLYNRDQNERTINAMPGPHDEKESLFEYLGYPLQIILAPMWAASHRNGPLCTVCWTRDRVRSFEDEDVALLGAFCNSAVANLARKDAISTMQTKSKFMESISHELRSPIHGILASADLLEDRLNDAESRSLLTNIQSSGATLLDTMNQLLVFTEMSNKKSPELEDGRDSMVTTINDETTDNESHINLGTLVEEVVDAISLGHAFKEAHGRDLEMERKGLASLRTLHNVLSPITTAVTIHPEAAKFVRTPVGALRRLLMILYSNALNFTSHGHVEVELGLLTEPDQDTGPAIQLVVRDSGRGISRRYQDLQMFDAFSQEHTGSAGIGLGLNIARRLVRNFGGTINVDSEEGIGTTMKATIPFTNLMALDERSEATNVYLPTLLREYVKGRSICLVNAAGKSSDPTIQPRPSIHDPTNNVLARSLKATLQECFGMQLVSDEKSPEAFMEIDRGEVFISRQQSPKSSGSKVQNPISPRTVAGAIVHVFDLAGTLDDGTRDVLQTYQPMDTRKTGLLAVAPSPTPDQPDERPEAESPLQSFTGSSDNETDKVSTDEKRTTNCLLVDDNEVNLKILGACLKKLGHSYAYAANGQAAVDAFRARDVGPFGIVFMDLSMPVLDGFEATKRIRAIEEQMAWPPAKIVVLSAYGTDESREKAMACGCDLFLTKPVSPRKITEMVQLLMG